MLQFAGTLSDGLGKTMDNRHQSEREYIRYHAATSGEHLVAGIHGLAHGKALAVRLRKNAPHKYLYISVQGGRGSCQQQILVRCGGESEDLSLLP